MISYSLLGSPRAEDSRPLQFVTARGLLLLLEVIELPDILMQGPLLLRRSGIELDPWQM